jgi:asparagine synthase (glutamine-hydrolysing)
MCGIVGIFGYGPQQRVDPLELDRIRDHMTTRGPDGSGNWLSDDGRVGFGHRRLAIIGPGAQGAQPMALDYCQRSNKDRLVITFNGEIYNHRELRQQLEANGHVFRSTCDTEVLLHLYEDHGADLVDHLRGMYAFGLWDALQQRLLLARDPFGVKPLYYADDGSTFRFASQARALLSGGAVSSTVAEGALAGFFVLGSVPEPRTAWTSIRSVPAGSTMTLNRRGAASARTFFSVVGELGRAADAPSDGDLASAIADSVRAHLVADVEVGAFLSAGVDSGAILALASQELGTVAAVTLGFDEFRGTHADETVLAALVARTYGAKHSVEVISRAECNASLPRFLAAMDQPSIDGLNTWFVSRAARQAGVKVALSGLGGDELTGGYSTFESVPKLHRRLRLAASVPGLGRAARAVLRAALPSFVNPKIASIVEYSGSVEMAWLLRRSVFLPFELGSLLGTDRAVAALEDLRMEETILRSVTHPDPGTDVTRVAAMESSLYMRNQLLRDADWASMAHSVEVRVPLVDAPLYRTAAPRFRAWSPETAKGPLAAAPSAPLPIEVVDREKTGFGLPMQAWVTDSDRASQWRDLPILAHPSCPWSRRWAYVVASELDLVGSQ